MKVVTKEDFENWILAQPDDREVRMYEENSDSICGCLMVQYARDHNLLNGEYSCGVYGWMPLEYFRPDSGVNKYLAKFEDEFSIEPWLGIGVVDFGNAKKLIK